MDRQITRLNYKQEEFCRQYLIDGNVTQAAIRSGYSKRTARQIAAENLTKPFIRSYIDLLRKERNARTLVDADFIINGLKEVANRCMQKSAVMEWDHDLRILKQAKDDYGNHVWEFDSAGANRALELLGRHVGLFDKKNIDYNNMPVDVMDKLVLMWLSKYEQPPEEIQSF